MPTTAEKKQLTVPQAAKREKVDPETVGRWIRLGIQGRSGETIRLSARKRGGRWVINPADLDDFSRRLTEAALAKPEAKA